MHKIYLTKNSVRCYNAFNIKNRWAREVRLIGCIQRAAGGGNAVTRIILNGLAREAWNQFRVDRRVGAYGNPIRYQRGAYDGMQDERMFYTSNRVVPQKLRLLSL